MTEETPEAAPRGGDPIPAEYATTCAWCGDPIGPGDLISARRRLGLGWSHIECVRAAMAADTAHRDTHPQEETP